MLFRITLFLLLLVSFRVDAQKPPSTFLYDHFSSEENVVDWDAVKKEAKRKGYHLREFQRALLASFLENLNLKKDVKEDLLKRLWQAKNREVVIKKIRASLQKMKELSISPEGLNYFTQEPSFCEGPMDFYSVQNVLANVLGINVIINKRGHYGEQYYDGSVGVNPLWPGEAIFAVPSKK